MVVLEASDILSMANFFDPGRRYSTKSPLIIPTAIPPRRKLSFILKGVFERRIYAHKELCTQKYFLSLEPPTILLYSNSIALRKLRNPMGVEIILNTILLVAYYKSIT
jgi:hypothetical protein